MPLPQYVYWRGNRLTYRRAYPKEVWPVVGKGKSFVLSLRTSDPAEAARARPEAERRYHARVDEARMELAQREATPPLSRSDAKALAVRWFLEALKLSQEYREGDPQAAREAATEARERIGECRRIAAEGDWTDMLPKARRVRERAGYGGEPEADKTFARLLTRAAIAANEVELGRARGRLHTRPEDPLFASAMEASEPTANVRQAPSEPPPKVTPGQTVADLVEAFKAARFPRITEASQTAYEPVFRVLTALLGENTPLASITHDHGQKLFAAVRSMPANANKRKGIKERPLPEQIAEGKRLGFPTLSPKTINETYMGGLSTLFRFAKQRGWITINPVEGLRALDQVADRDRRDPFTADQLHVLFGGPPWAPRNDAPDGKAVRYFGPLLGLYHGLRRAEIVGLRVEDITQEVDTPLVMVRAGDRRLKGGAARRALPLHPELERLGFLDFVRQRRKAAKPKDTLFPGEKPNARGQWGRQLGEWFSRRVEELGLEGRKLGLHSLRHNFADALREGEVDPALAAYLKGHAESGMGAIYGRRDPSLAQRKAAIAKVRYDGLALPAKAA